MKNYQWFVLAVGVLCLVLSNAINFGPQREAPGRWGYGLVLAAGIAMHFGSVLLISHWWQARQPGLSVTPRRVLLTFLSALPVVTLLMTISDWWLRNWSALAIYELRSEVLLLNLTQAAVTTIFVTCLSEAFYHYTRLLRSEREREELLRINLYAQYDSLKQQVSPHFLFNSLNSLSSLISVDPQRAEQFIGELSRVYRYLLQSNREELVPLGRELDFVRSYVHLLTTRFGTALRVHQCVAPELTHWLIPPLTLQLLVENAVKHNEVSSENPLEIYLDTEANGYLVIRNNLQRRLAVLPSEKVGLANIIAKYRLLGQPEVRVQETADTFSVALPLVAPIAVTP